MQTNPSRISRTAHSNTRAAAKAGAVTVTDIDAVVDDDAPREPEAKAPEVQHESGALAAWGLLLGAGIGSVIGLFFRQTMSIGAAGGAIGWFAGALIERYRR